MRTQLPAIAVILTAVYANAVAQVPRPEPLDEGTSALRGTVTDALTKAPIAGCEVRAGQFAPGRRRAQSAAVRTSADGVYEFAGIAAGDYLLSVNCPSHIFACMQLDERDAAPCGMVNLLRDQQRSDLNFRLTPGATARGRVVDGSGRPVAQATLFLVGPFDRNVPYSPAMTKTDGTFELPRLPGGKWRLEVDVPSPPGGPRLPRFYYPGVLTREEAGFVELIAGRVTTNITVTVPRVLDSTLTGASSQCSREEATSLPASTWCPIRRSMSPSLSVNGNS